MKKLRSTTALVCILAVALLTVPVISFAIDCLRGTWIVRCPNGHDDQVDDITCNHDCEKCDAKAVDGGRAMVVCPAGHATQVTGITESHLCNYRLPNGGICGQQCRR